MGIGRAAPGDASATVFEIVRDESAARYRAKEDLVSVGATEAVGATNAIIGQIVLDDDGQPVACSRFDVDLRTLESDDVRRDNYLYTNTLESDQAVDPAPDVAPLEADGSMRNLRTSGRRSETNTHTNRRGSTAAPIDV